jgi:ABC-type sugar transport system ATPase subunit
MLEVRGLEKRFGGVAALGGVSLSVRPGRVHALLGENGAGKSTLLKCLSGVHAPDAGEMTLDGVPHRPSDPRAAEAAGLRIVHQELNLVPGFTAYENAFVGRRYPRRLGMIDRSAMRRRMAEARDALGLDLDLDLPVGRQSTAKCQIVEILRALMDEARILILDEPTASLSENEAATLRAVVRDLAGRGTAIVYVSHRLEEVFEVADDYTVLRNGRTVAAGPIAELTREGLVSLMAGEVSAELHRRQAASPSSGGTMLRLTDFRVGPARPPLSLEVGEGEIVGLYGIVGSGRSSLLKAVWGAGPLTGGGIEIAQTRLPARGIGPRLAAGVAYVGEDRRGAGLVMDHSILDNAALPRLADYRRLQSLPLLSWSRMRAGIAALMSQARVRHGRLGDRISTLSGGNQQKVMVGRWTGGRLNLFLLDEPTRGVDVRSKADIHDMCRTIAGQGAAILFATSDLEELLALANRIVVMAHGTVTLDRPAAGTDRQAILEATFRQPALPHERDVA